MKVIYFDTETTGLNSKFDRIIELAMLTVEDGEIVDDYDKFVNIGRDLPPKITRITGITNDDLILKDGAGQTQLKALPVFLYYYGGEFIARRK